jgi:DNA-binding CsgD family transcriptional regulator
MKKYIFLFFIFLSAAIYGNYQVKDSKENVNRLKVSAVDTSVRLVLPLQIEPASNLGSLKNITDSLARAKELIKRGKLLIDKAEYGLAMVQVCDAIRICPENQIRTKGIAKVYMTKIHIYTGNFATASKLLNSCDTLFRKSGDLSLVAMHYNNVGLYYRENGKANTARDFFYKALSINRQLQDSLNMAENLNNLGSLNDLPEESVEYLMEAEKINKKLNNPNDLSGNYNNLAQNYIALKKFPEALTYLNLALKSAGKNISPKIFDENEVIRSEYLAAMGNYKEAYNKRIEIENNRRLRNKKFSLEGISQVIHQRELNRKEYEKTLQEQEYKIKLLNRSLVAVTAIAVLVVLLSLSIYYFILHKKRLNAASLKNKLAEKELAYVNAEIVNMATFLNSRNEILQSIQDSLSKISKMPEKEIQSEARRLNLYVKNLQVRNNEVDSIMSKMTDINNEFLQRLGKLHPDLTKNDKNIALLLRANLTTKQIAILMDCSPKSVNMARYRMRLHLNLENDQNLVNYLREL